jgi:hypothetical protein
MRLILHTVALFVALSAAPASAEDAPRRPLLPSPVKQARAVTQDIWILSGQSNASGAGELPGPEPDPRVRVFHSKTGNWETAKDPLPGMMGGRVGPWLYAAIAVVQQKDLRLDLNALGIGGHVIGFWAEDQWLGQGLVKQIRQAGGGGGVFLWYQGESDAGTPTTNYLAALKDLVSRFRGHTGNPDLTAVIVQLSSCSGHDMVSVQEAQRQFVVQDGNALLVPALGRPMQDDCHLNKAGQASLGQEIARGLLKHRYGVAGINWPGPVMEQAVLGPKGRTIVAHFAEVTTLTNALAADFEVRRGKDRIVCASLKAGNTVLTLTFDQLVTLPAQLVYGGRAFPGSALQDESGNHAPAVLLELRSGPFPRDEPTSAPSGAGPTQVKRD